MEDPNNYDDLLWWALAYSRTFDLTQQRVFARYAKKIYDYVYSVAWDEKKCNGGMWWSARRQYKNAITNEVSFILKFCLQIHRMFTMIIIIIFIIIVIIIEIDKSLI